jgi:hypothetical protein
MLQKFSRVDGAYGGISSDDLDDAKLFHSVDLTYTSPHVTNLGKARGYSGL